MATTSLNTFYENVYWPVIQSNPETAIAATTYYPASGSFVDVSNFKNFAFLIHPGALDTALTFQVVQATSASGTPKDVTGAVVTVGAGADNTEFSIDVATTQLDSANGYTFVSLYATGASGSNDYAALNLIAFNPRYAPVTQTAAYPSANAVIVVA